MPEIADVSHELGPRVVVAGGGRRANWAVANTRRARDAASVSYSATSARRRAVGAGLLGVVVDAVVDGERLARPADAVREAGIVEP